MKKLISLLLALLMVFSVATVAFAAEGDPQDGAVTGDTQEPAQSADDQTPAQDPKPADEEKKDEEKKDDAKVDTEKVEELLGKFKDMPSSTRHTLFILGKIALKFVKIGAKLGIKFGLIDMNSIVNSVAEAFGLDPETELPAGTADAIRTII